LYDTYAVQGFHIVSDAMAKQFGHGLDGMPWLLPFIVLYASTASAFMVANSALMKRENSAQGFWGAIVHAGWLFAVPLFLLDAVRYRVVTRFARQNSLLFVAYVASFVFIYVAARFVNDDFLAPYIRHNPTAAAAVAEQVQKDLAAANKLIPQ
jgi:membrane-bound acyltransferase YfiQ involved in biofilm formation